MTKYMTHSTGQKRMTAVISHIISQPGGGHFTPGKTIWWSYSETVSQHGLWAAGFVLTGGRCDPWLPWEDMIGFFKHFRAGRKIKKP